MKMRLLLLQAITAISLFSAHDSSAAAIEERRVAHGGFLEYVPDRGAVGLLVIVHGTPGPSENAAELARKFIHRWTVFAEVHSLAVVAPVFDDEYGSRDKPTAGVAPGGYRGLFGRRVGADAFLDEVVSAAGKSVTAFDGRFFLYGHSAGGQFTSRYCVRHPERSRAAIISAGGRYAFSNPTAPWPYGMAASQHLRESPDPDRWRRAAMVPITVVVGTDDIEPQPARPGHEGRTRVELAENWVRDMNRLAQQSGKAGRIRLRKVSGVSHDSSRLTPAAQQELAVNF